MTARVACAQVPLSIGDTAGNRTTCRSAIEKAAGDGAQIVVLPELASSGYVFADRAELSSLAEPRDGPAIAEWANLAEALRITIVGGFPEAAGDAVYNSAAVVDPTGLRGVYRKAHLWDSENSVFDRGDDLPMVVDTEHGRIGVMLCYDIEFPEWVRAVALSGADLLCAPVNWPLLPRPAGERPTEMVRALAGGIDLVAFWSMFLEIIGLQRLSERVTIGQAAGVVITLYVLVLLCKVGWAAMFG